MEVHPTVLAHDGTDFFDRLNDTGLVVHRHHRNKRSVRADGSFELLEIKDTVLLDSEVGNFEALLLQFSTRIKDTLVLLFLGPLAEVPYTSELTV